MNAWKAVLSGALLMAGIGVVAQGRDVTAPSLVPAPVARMASTPAAPPTTPAGGRALTKEDLDAWLDGYMPYALRSGDIPGAVVTVVKDGKILTSRGFGYADLARKTPVDPDRTLFRPGSVSKLVTWTAVMQQVEQGKIDLDGDINRYLDFKLPDYQGKPVTMRQVMTHTAGFEEAANGIISTDHNDFMPLDRYIKRWTPARIFAPGTTPAYSNWATTLAGYVVQRVSGQPFDDYLDAHIFAPLGMRNATFRQPLPATLASQMATAYAKPGTAGKFEFVIPAPAGSLSASGTDMGRFMIAHLNNGAGLLKPETAAMMHDSPLDKVDPMSLMPPLNRMELGFFETNINGREVIGHLGDTNAFHTSLHLFLRDNVGFFVSFNSPGRAGAVGALRTAVFEDFADRYLPNIAAADGRVDAKTAAEHVRMMAGDWIASRRSDKSFLSAFMWLLGQDHVAPGPQGELVLPVKSAGGRPRQWVEIAPFVWRDIYGHDRVAAKVVDGKVVRWVMDLAAPFEVFERVPFAYSARWIMPALYLSLGILLIAFAYWPIGWAVRRTYRAPGTLAGRARQANRATRLMAGLVIVTLGGWLALIMGILSSPGPTSPMFMLTMQLASIVVFFGAALMAGWSLFLTWTDGRDWKRKLWSALVFLATLLVLYVAVAFHLTTLTSNY